MDETGIRPVCVWTAGAELGEGPIWSDRDQLLYWVDIIGSSLHAFDPATGEKRIVASPELGCIAERSRGGLIGMIRSGLVSIDLDECRFERLTAVEENRVDHRFNDGKCDAEGRFWTASMKDEEDTPTGVLYRIDADRTVHEVEVGFFCPNGPVWSLDESIVYHTESAKGLIYAFDFDRQRGSLTNKRIFASVPAEHGVPDGMTVDGEDCLWVAHWGGSRVTRFRRSGKVDRVIRVPVPYVTSCAFGGREHDMLYITTAAQPMSLEEREASPGSGGLFAFRPGVAGIPSTPFAG